MHTVASAVVRHSRGMPQQGCAGRRAAARWADATYLACLRVPRSGVPWRVYPCVGSRYRIGTVRVGHYLQVHVLTRLPADALQRGCGVDVSKEEQPWLGWGLG